MGASSAYVAAATTAVVAPDVLWLPLSRSVCAMHLFTCLIQTIDKNAVVKNCTLSHTKQLHRTHSLQEVHVFQGSCDALLVAQLFVYCGF